MGYYDKSCSYDNWHKKEKMQDIVRDLKKYTAKAIINAIKDNPTESRKEWMLWMFERAGTINSNNSKHQFWQAT